MLTLELSPSLYGNYNISYFGGQDGYIDLTVTGGIPPYTYKWSNQTYDEDLWGVAAGYYRVYVSDFNGNLAEAEITLDEPAESEPPPAPCNTTINPPMWSSWSNPLTLWTCPQINVAVGGYWLPPPGMRFSVYGNSYFSGSTYIGIHPSTVALASGATPYKLLVGGKIGAKEMWCAPGTPWPDYVFDEDYQLKSLDELEIFVMQEKHLPGLPSADEVKKMDKINMGEMLTKILEKTEENTLYILQLKKENDLLKTENKNLHKLLTK